MSSTLAVLVLPIVQITTNLTFRKMLRIKLRLSQMNRHTNMMTVNAVKNETDWF